MAFDQTFAAAYIDNGNTHRVLGVKLRPFCAWHLFLMQVADSPFLNEGQAYFYHLRRAVGICRLRFPDNNTKLPLYFRVMTQKRFHSEVSKFLIYTGDYIHKPDYNIIPIDGGQGGKSLRTPSPAPSVIQLVHDAAYGANIPVHEAWNLPIGQAYISQAMYYRKQGLLVDFMNDDEREFQEALKKYESERRAKGLI